jgi:hypothetical protein
MSTPHYVNPRQHPRNKGVMVIDLVAHDHGDRSSVRAATLDLSSGGLRIQTPVSLVAGERIDVFFANRPASAKPCEVAWTKPAGSNLPGQAGLKFIEALGEDDPREEYE